MKIFIVSGPSGSGKTTLVKKILADKKISHGLVKSVSFTTRKIRPGEKPGRDYFFIREGQFRRLLKAKKILEWTRYTGYYYGTLKGFMRQQFAKGKDVILCLDLKGAFRLKRLYPEKTVTIFIKPPSLSELKERIAGRSCNTGGEEVRRRLEVAKKEISAAKGYDYRIVNRNLAQAYKALRNIILTETANSQRGVYGVCCQG